MLGLEPPLTTTKQQRQRQPPGEESGREDGRNVVGVAIDEGIHQSSSHEAFDVSVLCTAYADVNALFEPHSRVESRLGGALLWNVNKTIWNIHSVSQAFGSGAIPPAAHEFAARVPSKEEGKEGKTPPPSFLTVYGSHVGRWAESLQEAY
ncbi:unnamed protein product, partial [Pylaiella littoralis]